MQNLPPKPAGMLDFGPAHNYGDGTISFQLNRQDGQSLAASCPIPSLANIINYFCQFARQVTAEEATELTQEGTLSVVPVPVDDIGIAPAPDDPNHTVFVVRLGGFHLALAVPNTTLSEFGSALAATVTTLSASTERRN
jgi:hypothetical protein